MNKKAYIYPVVILLMVGLIASSVVSVVYKMGLQVNPPQPDFSVEAGLKSYIVWVDEDGWKASREGDFSIFNSSPIEVKKGVLKKLLEVDNSEVILLNIKADIGKEKVKSLLETLAQFPLKKVYVVSAFDNSLENLRKAEPRFWFAPSPKTWIKWSLMLSLIHI